MLRKGHRKTGEKGSLLLARKSSPHPEPAGALCWTAYLQNCEKIILLFKLCLWHSKWQPKQTQTLPPLRWEVTAPPLPVSPSCLFSLCSTSPPSITLFISKVHYLLSYYRSRSRIPEDRCLYFIHSCIKSENNIRHRANIQ